MAVVTYKCPSCDAELTLRIMDFPAPELAAAMRGRGQELGLA